MNSKLKEQIQPYWVEEQQGVYIPLIDKVLLKNNVPEMPYGDYMEYAKSNGVQIATKDELLYMYLQKDDINKILKEHGGDILDNWFGSSSEYGLYYEWFVSLVYGYCYYATKLNYSASRAVVDLKFREKDVYPIILDESILMQNNFNPEIVSWWRPSEGDSFKIAIMNNDTSLCAKVKYVHELQHALRLCGLSELAENLKVL